MSNFWPDGLDIKDIRSPKEILKAAHEDWRASSDGVIELVLQDTVSQTDNPMIIVHAKHVPSNRTVTLFSVVYRHNNPYPAKINLKDEDLPNFLKKSEKPAIEDIIRKQTGSVNILESLSQQTRSTMFRNTFVSDTPSEFQKQLIEVFNKGIIKRQILNIVSTATDNVNNTNEESLEDSVEN